MLISSSKYDSKFILKSAGKTTLSADVELNYNICGLQMHFTRTVYNEIKGTKLESCQRSIHSQFIWISHVKSQPITKKHLEQEYKFFKANQ